MKILIAYLHLLSVSLLSLETYLMTFNSQQYFFIATTVYNPVILGEALLVEKLLWCLKVEQKNCRNRAEKSDYEDLFIFKNNMD